MHLSRFTLYETRRGFWIVGCNLSNSRYRVLQLVPDPDSSNLRFAVEELPDELSQPEFQAWLAGRQRLARNENDEFVQKAPPAWGMLGLIRFTACYYLCIVTKCSVVAMLGGNQIFHIEETKLVPLVHSSQYVVPDRRSVEARLASTFHSLDLTKTFYFSSTYDLTNTLQTNLSAEKRSPGHDEPAAQSSRMFVWNSYLLQPLQADGPAGVSDQLRKEWFLQVVHGFIDQARISVFGNNVYITLIARRSHEFAGARFYKRGVNKQGYPANEVETEQIVSNQLDSQFSDRYTSYVQHRGSICVSWSQMSNNMSPQPPIRIDAVDPYYEAAAKHFDRMFSRYGYPVRVLSLVKTREKRPRESALSHEFEACIRYLNQFLPQHRRAISRDLSSRRKGFEPIEPKVQTSNTKPSGRGLVLSGGVIEYTHWDMSRAAKSQSSVVMDYLGTYANETLKTTAIFHAGRSTQQGVCRTNCIDCLDRTNAAQSVIAKYALGYQLHALGIIDRPKVDYDTDVIDLLTEMYHDHGDTLALQYGGSNLVNTVETYRRINQWSSHSRDLIESIRRFYSNSFMDAQRQDAINVFLGNYQYTEGTNLWDLSTDYYLHNSSLNETKRSYRQWYEPRHLYPPPVAGTTDAVEERGMLREAVLAARAASAPYLDTDANLLSYNTASYNGLTSLSQLFMAKINSTDKYSKQLSPFEVRDGKHAKRRRNEQSTDQAQPPVPPNKTEAALVAIDQLEFQYTRYLGLRGIDTDESSFYDEYLVPEKSEATESSIQPVTVEDSESLYAQYVM